MTEDLVHPAMRGTKITRSMIFACLVGLASFAVCCKSGGAKGGKTVSDLEDTIRVIVPGRVTRIGIIGAPDTVSSEPRLYYGLSDIALGSGDLLYALDQQVHAVRVISVGTGKEVNRFGRKGAGPEEFQGLNRAKYVPGKGLLVIDDFLRRATIFSDEGKVLETIPLSFLTDDVIFLDDVHVLSSSFLLVADHKPLKILTLGDREFESFGEIVEPQKGLFAKIAAPGSRGVGLDLFSYGWMTRIIHIPGSNKVIYSQTNPYCLFLYDLSSRKGIRLNVSLPFSTDDETVYETSGTGRRISLQPSGKVLQPILIDNRVLGVPIFSGDVQRNFLDIYELNGTFKQRCAMPALSEGLKPIALTSSASGNEIYILVMDSNTINWIERFAIRL